MTRPGGGANKYGNQKRYAHEHVEFLPYSEAVPPKKFKHSHTKPYRRRHVVTLSVFVAIFCASVFVMGSLLLGGWYYRNLATKEMPLVGGDNGFVSIQSTRGFALQFNEHIFAALGEASYDDSLGVYTDKELNVPRPYNVVTLTPRVDNAGRNVRYDNSLMRIWFDTAVANEQDLHVVAQRYHEQDNEAFSIVQMNEQEVLINGQIFLKQTFEKIPRFGNVATSSKSILYITLHNGQPLVINVSGVSEEFTPIQAYDEVIDSVVLTDPAAAVLGAAHLHPEHMANWLDPLRRLVRNFISDDGSPEQKRERVVATYTPAVVKVYHLVCGDLMIMNNSVGYDCVTTTGSGFFVSSDGYIATSGHVVSISAKDVIVEALRTRPETVEPILRLLGMPPHQANQTLQALQQDPQALTSLLQYIHNLPDEAMYFSDQRNYYVVAFGREPLQLNNANDKRRLTVRETPTVRLAELIATNYNSADLVNDSFTKSDVAILKISGDNYPVVRLGDINLLTRGTSLTVIGYPLGADNQLTDNKTLMASTTTGLVSAVRHSNDGQYKIVQSDAVISGGNSGGPALDEQGRVFGIATYVYRAAEGAMYSYMRDVQDLVGLASRSGIDFDHDSETQRVWEDALDNFYSAHYTKAIKQFDKVKELYPAHTLADQYIHLAEDRINNGQEARGATLLLIAVAALIVSSLGMVVMIVVILRHYGKHHHYKALRHE